MSVKPLSRKENKEHNKRIIEQFEKEWREENERKDYSSYRTQRAVLIEYLHVMIARCDWHGVADVAMDMRELEAEKLSK